MPPVLALVDDLMFLSRLREAARGASVEIRPVRAAADLLAAARGGAPLVVVDADSVRLPWSEAVTALRAEPLPFRVPVLAFVSHVDADRIAAARAAGCDRVIARGAFVQELPGLLARAAEAPPTPTTQEEPPP